MHVVIDLAEHLRSCLWSASACDAIVFVLALALGRDFNSDPVRVGDPHRSGDSRRVDLALAQDSHGLLDGEILDGNPHMLEGGTRGSRNEREHGVAHREEP